VKLVHDDCRVDGFGNDPLNCDRAARDCVDGGLQGGGNDDGRQAARFYRTKQEKVAVVSRRTGRRQSSN
jgi:hypothetical protein